MGIDLSVDWVDIAKLAIAIVVGGVIGAEREYRDKAAGFRTIIFICVGAALFTILSAKLAGAKDPTRIAANVVTGVGFLGAGVLMRDGGRVTGLTTAASIWLSASIGMGIGAGHIGFILVAVGLFLMVLWIFPLIEFPIDSICDTKIYTVVLPMAQDKFKQLEETFLECGLKVTSHKHMRRDDNVICVWGARGAPRRHDILVEKLLTDPDVRELSY